MQEYQEAFRYYDTDHDGFIGVAEVGKVMRAIGLYPSEAELAQFAKTASRNKIDFNEFLAHASKKGSH